MSRTTKTVAKIKVSAEEMTVCKEETLAAIVQLAAERIQKEAEALCAWAKNEQADTIWTYMPNKDIFYVPQIVGVMPNLAVFEATCQKCSNSSFEMPSAEQMKFAGLAGDFPTPNEASRSFGRSDIYCRDGRFIRVKNTTHDGVTVQPEWYSGRLCYRCYNICRGGVTQRYGEGSSSDSCWNIPIYRFNGEDSPTVSFAQTILCWLQYDLRPAAFKANTDLGKAYDFLRRCDEYLAVEGEKIVLDSAKAIAAIHDDEVLPWLPEEAAGILSATALTVTEDVKERFKERLLRADEYAIALDPYDEKILSDPNRGHWDLWDRDAAEAEDAVQIDVGEGLTARSPAADVSDGIVAIDFGTKSTVVVYETDELQVLPLQVGSGTYSKGLQAKNYENPTVLQFIDLDAFLAAYAAREGRPATRWDDLTVSHNAFQNLKDASSDQHGTFFDGLKQWCGTSGQRLKLQDARGKIWELPAFMDLEASDMDPLEIYAYYLGRYINHMLRGKIFLHYVMSFPVTYEHRIREHMGNSIRRGLRKSFPTALLADEARMKDFRVLEVASEPAAYAITALQEYGFDPEEGEAEYYAVFDFGGGTTDFDFGVFKESEDDRYDYVLTHFGENGDRTLGGENLLRLLAFEVFRANKEYLLNPDAPDADAPAAGMHIPFAMAPDAQLFTGHESLLKNSREAQQNMRNLMEKLRPVWEAPESEEAKQLIEGGQIQLTLYRENGEKKTDANLKLKIGDDVVDLQAMMKKRIEQGVRRFFTSLAEAFDKSVGSDNRIAALSDVKEISVFLAGNSSRSPLVKQLFDEYLASAEQTNDAKEEEASRTSGCTARSLLKFGDNQPMPQFSIYPPLGTQEADAIREALGDAEDTREEMMRPTGKTGVAYGLLKCRDGGEIKVESITPDGARVPFQYYIGRRKKGKFRPVIDRNAKLKTWYKFIDAGGAFDILYTDRPEAAMGDAPMTIAKQKHVSIAHPDKNAFVYIRPVESRVIEYMIARDESELTAGGGEKCDPIRIELE